MKSVEDRPCADPEATARTIMEIAAGVEPVHPTPARIADIDDQHAIYVVRGKSLLNLGNGACAARKRNGAGGVCSLHRSEGRPTPDTHARGLREHRD
jgi:hypothetical protein